MTQGIFINSKLPPKTRDLILAVCAGEPQTLPHLYTMSNLFRVDEVLGWLVENEITGKKFLGWMKEEFDGSLLKTISFILMRVNRDLVMKPVIVGKDIQ